MTQPAAPHAASPLLLQLNELELHAVDEVLQPGLADPR